LPLPAAAQSGDRALAETLFADAKRLMTEGKLDQACPKFDDSYRAFPGTGTLINAAACYESAGKTATAWARYGEASGAAQRDGNQERLSYVKERRDALEPRLSKVKIEVSGDVRATPGLEIKINERLIPATAFGLGVPVDPGKAVVSASAPQHVSVRRELDAVEGSEQTVTIDKLEKDPSAVPVSSTTKPGAPGTDPPTEQEPKTGSSQRTLGYIVGGVGVVGLGVGVAFNLMARSAADQADQHCLSGLPEGTPCTVSSDTQRQERESNVSDAATNATVSYVGLGVGAAAIATGIVLVVTAGGSDEKPQRGARLAPWVSASQLGVGISGWL
jgi:hypothetical protein